MKRFTLLTFLLFAFLGAFAQNISVKSFKALPMDMSASSLEGKRIDQNGEVAALIKVMTTETGFVFEGGTLGIVDSQQRVGEIWVWVPRASRKITILHQQLGGLRDYRYPVEIEAERTYEMVLTTAKMETVVKENVRMQYLTFQITPPNATLEVNDQLWSVDADGIATRYVDFGTYTYRVRAADYFPDAGCVIVDDPENTKLVPVTLKSNHAEVTLTVNADAEIWVNNERKGVRTWTGPLGNGTYRIECRQAGHESTVVSKEITTEMNGQTITLTAPQPIYGSLSVESTPQMATLYIDGKEMGKTPKSVNEILVGEHEIKLVKDGYANYTEIITIAKGVRKQVKPLMNKQEETQTFVVTNTNTSEDQTFTVKGVSFTMKFVEGGTLQMGMTPEQGKVGKDAKPKHSVTLSSYCIGETEVTQELWKAVMGENPSYNKGEILPVEQVSWHDCQVFIRRLNQETGKNFRLPTEAEWEYAARGGKKSNTYKYSGSNTIDDVAWHKDKADIFFNHNEPSGRTHAVKTKLPNELGLYDMSGNVWEWCQDWYGKEYYEGSPSLNPQGPSSGSCRVLRGGSWCSFAGDCRVSYRNYGDPDDMYYNGGLRLSLSE